MDQLCYLNYQSKLGLDNYQSYEFWFASNLIRIRSPQPFGRGDLARITSISQSRPNEHQVIVDVIGDPKLEILPSEIDTTEDIPTLLVITTKIYTSDESRYQVTRTKNVDVLLFTDAVINNNKAYSALILARGNRGMIEAIDDVTGAKMEWLVTDLEGHRNVA